MTGRIATRGTESGFTLLELIVAVAIFTVVVGAIYALLEVGRSDNFTANQRVEILQNARVALEQIRRDANNAGDGFWKSGANVPNLWLNTRMFLNRTDDAQPDSLGPVVPGNDRITITVDGAPVATDVVAFAYSDLAFNGGGGDIGITAITKSSNTCQIDSAVATNANIFTPGRLYIVDNGNRPVIGVFSSAPDASHIVFGSGDALGINVTGNTGMFQDLDPVAPNAACRSVIVTCYFVNPNGVLIRRTFGPQSSLQGTGVTGPTPYPGYVDMPLAFGVENFQIQYVLDSGVALDDIALDTDWQRVRMIRANISVRSPELDTKTGQYIRETIGATFFARNLANQERPPAS